MAVSAIGHIGLVVFVFFVMPRLFHSDFTPPPSYTVKIVDSLPAGDLGTHLPKLSSRAPRPSEPEQIAKAEPPPPPPEGTHIELPKPPEPDKNAVSLATAATTETPTPVPTPQPTIAPVATPTATPVKQIVKASPKASPTPKRIAEPHHTPVPKKPERKTPVAVAKASATPSVKDQLALLKKRLLAEQLKRDEAQNDSDDDDDEEPANVPPSKTPPASGGGSGPVVANVATPGSGMGVGSGTGSAGIEKDLDFLLYYRQVQQKIKDAWIYSSGSNDLTTAVDFAINPDGSVAGVKIAKSSNNPTFDDSVVRAIRRAAPFPAPPEKYRAQFAGGIEALFSLGELKS